MGVLLGILVLLVGFYGAWKLEKWFIGTTWAIQHPKAKWVVVLIAFLIYLQFILFLSSFTISLFS